MEVFIPVGKGKGGNKCNFYVSLELIFLCSSPIRHPVQDCHSAVILSNQTCLLECSPNVQNSVLIHPPLPTNWNLYCRQPSILVPNVTLLASIHFSVSTYDSSKISTKRWYPYFIWHHGLPKAAIQYSDSQIVKSASGRSGSIWNQVCKICHCLCLCVWTGSVAHRDQF